MNLLHVIIPLLALLAPQTLGAPPPPFRVSKSSTSTQPKQISNRHPPFTLTATFPDDPYLPPRYQTPYTVLFTHITLQPSPNYRSATDALYLQGLTNYMKLRNRLPSANFVPKIQTIYRQYKSPNEVAAKVYVPTDSRLPWRLLQNIAEVTFESGNEDLFFDGHAAFKATIWMGAKVPVKGTAMTTAPVGVVVVGPLNWDVQMDAAEWALGAGEGVPSARELGMSGVRQPDESMCVGSRCSEDGQGKEVDRTDCGDWWGSWRFLFC